MNILIIAGLVLLTSGALWLGRKWGLATGRKRAAKALAAQQAELLQQQIGMQQADDRNEKYREELAGASTPEEAASVVQQINTDWNSGS